MPCHFFHLDSVFHIVALALFLLVAQLKLSSVAPFQPIHQRTQVHIITSATTRQSYFPLQSKKGGGDDGNKNENGDDRTGMKGAFESLDALSSLDIGDLKDDATAKTESSIKADVDLLKAISGDDSSFSSSSSSIPNFSLTVAP
mmetsp:Transcript_17045/g.25453  ORF Transcript_17045/g.25453 Transcript_17045/m.25453 type:complete len:144 (+) Transcript_17045:41-472(+)